MADGILLGAVAGEVLRMVLEWKDQAVNFKEDFQRLHATLQHVVPLFEEARIMDLELNDHKRKSVEKLKGRLVKGRDLVVRCSRVRSWDIYSKIRLSSKIIKLDEAILSFCQRELQVEIWRDNKQLLRDVQQLGKKMDGLSLLNGQTNSSKGFDSGLCAVPQLPDRVVGFGIALRELKTELFKESVSVLGLCAPGGCGKSTLAAMLCRDKEVIGEFNGNIFFLTVSRTAMSTPTYALDILLRLLEEISGGVPPSGLSEENAIKQFHHILEERRPKPLLLVLDDVWEESIIEKFFSRTEGYKLLVTSRTAFNVYNSEYHSKYLLKTLSQEDSVTLFKQTVFSQYKQYEPDEDLQNEIVRCCDGFPLAITVIAKSLSQQPAVRWRIMAKKLSNGFSILDYDEKLRKCLSMSLDSLDDIVRECFLDLGSFPEDKRIPASALLDIWCEHDGLEDEDEAFVILLELESRNLVNLVGSRKIATEIDASYNELFVTQHDLLRDLAIYENRQQQGKRLVINTRERGLPESWRNEENLCLNAHLVSLCTGEMCPESLSHLSHLQFPKAEVMILNSAMKNYELPPFMEKMRNLKALIIVKRGRTHANLSSLMTIHGLANLKTIRLEKVSIPSLHEFIMPFTNLQKISLVMCDFGQTFFGQTLMKCTVDPSHVLPNLVEINIDYCHYLVELPPWICDIISLQTLSITNCDSLSALPERIGCITDLELLRLHACTALLKLPDSIKKLQKLRFLDISDCCNLRMLPYVLGELRCLKKLDMRGCIDLSELPPSAMNLVHLKEVICDEDTARLWGPLSSGLKITVLKKDNNLDWLGVDV